MSAALHDLGVGALAALLRQREVSSVELARHFLDRARRHADLGAWLALDEDAALAQARTQLLVFGGALAALVLLLAVSPWVPFWLGPAFTLLVIALAWLATTMLYVGFIYGRWEVNALMNVIEELELYRDNLAEQQDGVRS